MDFELSPEQRDFQETVRAFAQKELAPGVEQRYRDHRIAPEIMRTMAEAGLMGVNIKKDLGGQEKGAVAFALALREIAAVDASAAVTTAVTNMVGEVIARFGSDEHRERHVKKITSGEYYAGAFALSEPGSGSDAAALTTKAVRDGDGWILNGEKTWITSGDDAGVVVVWARTDDKKAGHRGISCFLVDGDAEGMTSGKPEEKMGLMASHTVSLSLVDVKVPASAMLSEEGQGFRIAMTALDGGRISIGSQSTGIGTAALSLARRYVMDHQRDGRPLANEQGVQFDLADIATEIDAAWLLSLRAAWLKEAGEVFSREAAMAKVYASEAANRAVREAVRIMGATGYAENETVQRMFRDCRVTQIYEGTSEVQRLVIARQVLK